MRVSRRYDHKEINTRSANDITAAGSSTDIMPAAATVGAMSIGVMG